jgi:formamidopyrimidine-DNA glycosylase
LMSLFRYRRNNMPELPEVETIKNDLHPYLVGRTVTGVTLTWPKAVIEPTAEELKRELIGETIKDIQRRGKYLIFLLSNGTYLILHMRMSGSLILKPPSFREPVRFSRTIFTLDNGEYLHFIDPRKFGMILLVADVESVVGKLGPEPLSPLFSPAVLGKLLSNHHAPIKALLCDQKLIAGIGNMYADEALFAARIHPLEAGNTLTKTEINHLYQGIVEVLTAGILHYGASTTDYYRPDGTKGMAHMSFKVAHRGGEPCLVCGTSIQRTVVRNRGTYFCPKCQKRKHI